MSPGKSKISVLSLFFKMKTHIWLDCKEKRLSQKVAELEKCFASFPVAGSERIFWGAGKYWVAKSEGVRGFGKGAEPPSRVQGRIPYRYGRVDKGGEGALILNRRRH